MIIQIRTPALYYPPPPPLLLLPSCPPYEPSADVA